jgi:peptide/nickel transport system ATP-binding protein
MENNCILQVRDLSIRYFTGAGGVQAVNGVSFSLDRGRTLGLVGETGAGKTTTALGLMRLVPEPSGRIVSGEILFCGQDILKLNKLQMRLHRGKNMSMIFQDPMTSLNPVKTVGEQIAEVIRIHEKTSAAEAMRRAAEMLETAGIGADRLGEYPHQFSGGMKQRVVIAMALACRPQLIIADEPTTALDVTIQAQILSLMGELQEKFGTAMLLITHDLGVVAETCDEVAILYAGRIIEQGSLVDIYKSARHPYAIGLFGAIPRLTGKVRRLSPIPGLMPDPVNLPPGCAFSPRCPQASDLCRTSPPENSEVSPGHFVRCHRQAQ